jgi:hypothetical protein
MANKIVCDICGGECESSGSYKLIYWCFLRTRKEDICYDCMSEIKKIIRENKRLKRSI